VPDRVHAVVEITELIVRNNAMLCSRQRPSVWLVS
jgi:hypothetical protein